MSLRPDRESDHERKACLAAAAAGWSAVKIQKRGWPDRLFWKNRVYVWVEFKRPGGRLRPQQGFRARQITRQGERVLAIDNWADLVPRLDGIT